MLSLLMALSKISPEEQAKRAENHVPTPVIVVHGMGGAPLYKMENGEITEVGSVSVRQVLSAFREHPGSLKNVFKLAGKDSVNLSEWNALIDGAAEFARTTDINCDSEGGANGVFLRNYWVEPLSEHPEYFDFDNGVTRLAKELVNQTGGENIYAFNYDWRLDLYDSGANGLNEFIHAVLRRTGAEQVILLCDSLGAATVNCYLEAHKFDGLLKRLIIVNGAFEGVDFASAFTQNLSVDADEAGAYLSNLSTSLDGGKYEYLFLAGSALFSGMMNSLSENLNNGFSSSHIQDRIFLECFKPVFGNIPAVFECIPYRSFDHAMECMTSIGFLDKDSTLYRKLQRYHRAQGDAEQNLKDVRDFGTQTAIIASYGYPGIPFTPNCRKQTDILIETEYESGGATVAYSGEKLDTSDGEYCSPDGEIDASTCVLKDSTWFFKNLRHVDFQVGTPAMELVAGLTLGKYSCSVKAVQKATGYGQFLLADANQNITNITPENTGDEVQQRVLPTEKIADRLHRSN